MALTVFILKESGIYYDRIYINNLNFNWQRESLKEVLKFLSIPPEKLLIINGDCIVQASSLIVPSVPFIPAKGTPLPLWLKDSLRKVFLGGKSLIEKEMGDRIYISRSKAASRRVINEEALLKELQKLGFKRIFLEDYLPHEQAKIFNEAKLIIGPHGSGFANLIFAKSGCHVVEIDHKIYPSRSYYKKMSKLLGCLYTPFYVDVKINGSLEEDFWVDIPKFMNFIKKFVLS